MFNQILVRGCASDLEPGILIVSANMARERIQNLGHFLVAPGVYLLPSALGIFHILFRAWAQSLLIRDVWCVSSVHTHSQLGYVKNISSLLRLLTFKKVKVHNLPFSLSMHSFNSYSILLSVIYFYCLCIVCTSWVSLYNYKYTW